MNLIIAYYIDIMSIITDTELLAKMDTNSRQKTIDMIGGVINHITNEEVANEHICLKRICVHQLPSSPIVTLPPHIYSEYKLKHTKYATSYSTSERSVGKIYNHVISVLKDMNYDIILHSFHEHFILFENKEKSVAEGKYIRVLLNTAWTRDGKPLNFKVVNKTEDQSLPENQPFVTVVDTNLSDDDLKLLNASYVKFSRFCDLVISIEIANNNLDIDSLIALEIHTKFWKSITSFLNIYGIGYVSTSVPPHKSYGVVDCNDIQRLYYDMYISKLITGYKNCNNDNAKLAIYIVETLYTLLLSNPVDNDETVKIRNVITKIFNKRLIAETYNERVLKLLRANNGLYSDRIEFHEKEISDYKAALATGKCLPLIDISYVESLFNTDKVNYEFTSKLLKEFKTTAAIKKKDFNPPEDAEMIE